MKDLWIALLITLVVLSCMPMSQTPNEPMAEFKPTAPTATPTATPKSACEFEVDSLKSDIESLQQRLRDADCDCSGWDEWP